MAKLIFGCGYLGLRVARLWISQGNAVYAVTRSSDRAETLAAQGIQPIVADLLASDQIQLPEGIRTVLFAVGYDRGSSQPIHDVYAGGIARALSSTPMNVERFLYISSTGVYGSVSGLEVNEDTPCQPT